MQDYSDPIDDLFGAHYMGEQFFTGDDYLSFRSCRRCGAMVREPHLEQHLIFHRNTGTMPL